MLGFAVVRPLLASSAGQFTMTLKVQFYGTVSFAAKGYLRQRQKFLRRDDLTVTF
jgi:hypothetical protein